MRAEFRSPNAIADDLTLGIGIGQPGSKAARSQSSRRPHTIVHEHFARGYFGGQPSQIVGPISQHRGPMIARAHALDQLAGVRARASS